MAVMSKSNKWLYSVSTIYILCNTFNEKICLLFEKCEEIPVHEDFTDKSTDTIKQWTHLGDR